MTSRISNTIPLTNTRITRRRGFLFIPALILVCSAVATLQGTRAAEPSKADKTIDRFLDACRKNEQLNKDQQTQVLEIVSRLRKDQSTKDAAIAESLRQVNADFAAALKGLKDGDTSIAVEKLRDLASSNDRFLAAESSFYLARHYVASEHFEQALPLLHKLTGDMSNQILREAEALLLRGIVQTGMLQRQEAIESFTQFLDENPNAAARLRAVAAGHLDLLEELELGSIDDIHEQMKFSRRRLSNEDSGKRTQEVQEDIVAMLNSIIEELEKKGGT